MNQHPLAQGAYTPSGGDAADSPPKFSFAQPGEVVVGQVTKAQLSVKTPHGEAAVIEVVDEQRGPLTLWLSTFQLRVAFVEGQNPLGRPVQAGDTIYVQYLNMEALDAGKSVKNFAVNIAAGQGQAPQAAPAPQPQAQGFAPPAAPAWQQPAAPMSGVVQAGEAPPVQWNTPPGQPF